MGEATATSDRAKEQVQEKAQIAQEKAKESAATLQSRVREQVDQRSTQAGEQMASSAQALRSTSERLHEDGQDGPARAAERAADQAERVGGYLKESDADRILHDVEDFGRRQPLAVAAIGIAAGFAASRFLKASSSSRYASRPSQRPALGEGLGGDAPRTAPPAAAVPSPTPGAGES
jgi:hypothetical protein